MAAGPPRCPRRRSATVTPCSRLGSLPAAEHRHAAVHVRPTTGVNPALRRLVASWDPLGGAGPTLRRQLDRAATDIARIRRGEAGSRRRSPTQADALVVAVQALCQPDDRDAPGSGPGGRLGLADAPGVLGFKIGKTVDGVARPDKMVAYFSSLDDLHGGADRIHDEARGCRPHGVPFTAGVTDDGLLSWAIDPPRGPGGTGHHAIVVELADMGLDAARRLPHRRSLERRGRAPEAGGEAWQVALARLQLDGVDTVELGAGSSHLRRRGAGLRAP